MLVIISQYTADQVNAFHTLNLQKVLCPWYFNKSGEKRQVRVLGRESSLSRSELAREEPTFLTVSFLLLSLSHPKSSSSPFPKNLALSSSGSSFKDHSRPGSWILAEVFWRLERLFETGQQDGQFLAFAPCWVPASQPDKLERFHRENATSPCLTESTQKDCRLSYEQGAYRVRLGRRRTGAVSVLIVLLESPEGQRSTGTHSPEPRAPPSFKHQLPTIDSVGKSGAWIHLKKFAEASSPLWNCFWPSWKESRTFCQWWAGTKVNNSSTTQYWGFPGKCGVLSANTGTFPGKPGWLVILAGADLASLQQLIVCLHKWLSLILVLLNQNR